MAVKKTKATKYVVLRGADPIGPFSIVGTWTTNGQNAAKKAAARAENEAERDPESAFFVAVPASSFYPQKPVLELTITFPTLEEEEAGETADAEAEDAEEEAAPEEEPEDIDPLLEEEAEFEDEFEIEEAPIP